MNSLDPAEKLILALDGMNEGEVFSLLAELPDLIWVKVGLELFTMCGPGIIQRLRNQGKRVFLDLKFHDIPTTMSHACYQAARSQAEILTVHACSGEDAMKQANQAAKQGAFEVGMPPPTVLAVTVLTSWTSEKLASDLHISQPIELRVRKLAKLAFKAGVGGCVCSPLEVKDLRIDIPEPFQLVTPGIRFPESSRDDQMRVLSPLEALGAGASKLVLGRILTKSQTPKEDFYRICSQLRKY